MPTDEVGRIIMPVYDVRGEEWGTRYTQTALVEDLIGEDSVDGPHIKPEAPTNVSTVPLGTDYSNGLVTGSESLRSAERMGWLPRYSDEG